LLYNSGGVSVGAADTEFHTVRLPANKFTIVYMGSSTLNGGLGVAGFDGLRCLGGFIKRFPVQNSGTCGTSFLLDPAGQSGSLIVPGATWYFQSWTRDTVVPCGTQKNFSNGYQIDFLP
jgi:hypothetical protein